MIALFYKQLIQWNFLERLHVQYQQKCVGREFQWQSLLDDRDERICCNGHPDLLSQRVLRCLIERLDPRVPFNPREEQFDLPAKLVEPGDCQGDSLVRNKLHCLIDGPRVNPARLEIRLGPDDEKRTVLLKGVKPGEVLMPSVQDAERYRPEREIVEDPDIVWSPLCHTDKREDRSAQVEKCMEFYGALAFVVSGPRERRLAHVDDRGIKGVNAVLEFHADVFAAIEPPFLGSQAGDKIAKASPICQLSEGQTEKLVEARKSPVPVSPIIPPDAFPKLVQWKESYNLGKEGRLGIHRALLDISDQKSADYSKPCSNRLRPRRAVSSAIRS